jgi:tRNA-binding EMAP/Myf-like protein
MSEFRCEVVKIGKVSKNPNADNLSITEVLGCPVQFRTGDFKEGDLAVYIPVDSMVPTDTKHFAFLKSKEHPNRTHERIKAKKLRQIFSMGMVIPMPLAGLSVGADLSQHLGVFKFEEPEDIEVEVIQPKGFWRRFTSACNKRFYDIVIGKPPKGASAFPEYDVESVRKYGQNLVIGEEVIINLKVHGQNSRFGWYCKEPKGNALTKWIKKKYGNKFYIGSRTTFKAEKGTTNWHEVARKYDLKNKLKPYPNIAIYGETFGFKVQDLTYGQTGKAFLVFDVRDLNTGRWFGYDEAIAFCKNIGLGMCPELYRGPWLGVKEHEILAEGLSPIEPDPGQKPCIREGWVVKPVKERKTEQGARVQYKFVGQKYLLRHNGTERH